MTYYLPIGKVYKEFKDLYFPVGIIIQIIPNIIAELPAT